MTTIDLAAGLAPSRPVLAVAVALAADSLDHLRRYVALLFQRPDSPVLDKGDQP